LLTLIEVWGKASGRVVARLPVENPNELLLFFLLRHGLPIASSCAGDGVCRKCQTSEGKLSCQLTLAELDGPVSFDYL